MASNVVGGVTLRAVLSPHLRNKIRLRLTRPILEKIRLFGWEARVLNRNHTIKHKHKKLPLVYHAKHIIIIPF